MNFQINSSLVGWIFLGLFGHLIVVCQDPTAATTTNGVRLVRLIIGEENSRMVNMMRFNDNPKLKSNSNKTRGLSPITGLSETSCSSDEIPKPTNYNSSNVTFDLKNSTVSSNRFLVGSTVNYVCQKGYFIHKQEHLFHSTTTCLPNGNWSRVQDCERLACFDNSPPAPLNGHKYFHLLLKNHSVIGVRVEVKCNQYFEIIGISNMVCLNGVWRTAPPTNTAECVLTKRLCFKKPPVKLEWNNATLSYFTGQKVKNELGPDQFEYKSVYTRAFYRCQPGQVFRVPRGRAPPMEMGISCNGEEAWEKLPACI